MAIQRLIHLLAHHPDFSLQDKELFEKYFEFVFKTIGTKENINCLILACEQMKMVEDNITYDNAVKDGIYYLSEMGIKVFTRMAGNWEMKPCTLKMPYPRLIIKKLPKEKASLNLLKQYT
eukprot:NODE_480_length_7860_cov_0.165958.p6 type:complete len:120 gc:universal NODE_480_length_7860_cov_0.165958:7237-7596(+)